MKKFFRLYILHALNDGFESGLVLFLPFIIKDIHMNLGQVGFLGAIINVMGIALAVPAVYIARKFESLRTMIYLVFIYSLSFFVLGISHSFTTLIFVFTIAGIGFGVFNTIGLALASHWAEKGKRSTQMGIYSSMGDYGNFIIAGGAVFLAARIGWRDVSFLYGVIGIACFIVLKFFSHIKSRESKEEVKISKHVSLLSFFKNKRFVLANIVNMFDTLGGTSIYLFLPFLLLQKHISLTSLGLFTGVYFFGTLFGKVLLGRVSNSVGSSNTLILAEIFMAVSIIILVSTNYQPLIFVLCLLLGAFAKGTIPVIKSMVAESSEHHKNFDKAFGINLSISGVARTVSPLLLGFLSNYFGVFFAFVVSALCSLIVILPAILYRKSSID